MATLGNLKTGGLRHVQVRRLIEGVQYKFGRNDCKCDFIDYIYLATWWLKSVHMNM